MKAPWSSNKGLKCFKKKRFVHFWLTCLKNIKENEVAIVPVSFVFGTALALFSWFCRLPRSSLSAVWQYGLWSFQTGDTKLEIFLPKNQHTQKKLLNFEFWINGELSKSAKI